MVSIHKLLGTMDAKLLVRRADFWIASAVFQGERVLAHLDAQEEAGSPDALTAEHRSHFAAKNGLGEGHLVEELEGHFFMVALHNARRFADRLKKLARKTWPQLTGEVVAFEHATAHVDDLRDMWEHEDEYLAGRGDAKERYLHTTPDFVASAHSIVLKGDVYLLGGRVDVNVALKAARSLREEFNRAKAALTSGT